MAAATAVGLHSFQAKTIVFIALLIFRIINSQLVQTFFQPDEYFQALEPAWQIAFGPDSGAWITWVRSHNLTSRQEQHTIEQIFRNGEKAFAPRCTPIYLQPHTKPSPRSANWSKQMSNSAPPLSLQHQDCCKLSGQREWIY